MIGGIQLLCNESMPAARGGKLRIDPARGAYVVDAGFVDHPAYWVTWLGAALFARYNGARLPTWAEVDRLSSAILRRSETENCDFRVGDTTSVVEPGLPVEAIHHRLGNVQVWCADGPDYRMGQPIVERRCFAGAAWNTPGDQDDVSRAEARHITGSSRAIGIRLVRDTDSLLTTWSVAEIARRVAQAVDQLRGPDYRFSVADANLARLLYEVQP